MNHQIESNRLAKVGSQEAVPVEPHANEGPLKTLGYDKYKCTLGDVILLDGMSLNHQLVKQGWCWWFRKYEGEGKCQTPSS